MHRVGCECQVSDSYYRELSLLRACSPKHYVFVGQFCPVNHCYALLAKTKPTRESANAPFIWCVLVLSLTLLLSCYSPRLVAIEREYDVAINVRPVYPIAIRTPDFFKRVNPMWFPYLLNDCKRIAEMEGVPFAWPSPDPVVQDLETREIASEQPYIHRLTRLGVAATEGGNGLAFISEVSRLIFGGVKGWNTGDYLTLAAERVGLSLSELDAKVSANAEAYDTKLHFKK